MTTSDITTQYIYYYAKIASNSKRLSDTELVILKHDMELFFDIPNTPNLSQHSIDRDINVTTDILAARKRGMELKNAIITNNTFDKVINKIQNHPRFVSWWPTYPKRTSAKSDNRPNEVW